MFYYHIYNRGAHKAAIFNDTEDYRRMLRALYMANCSKPFCLSKVKDNVFELSKADSLVDILAYCLMPNHIHIAVKAMSDIAVTKFMRKLCTSYSKYYNVKYDHSGTIWQGKYKSKPFEEKDLSILISYIHLNPYGIKEPLMTKEARKERPFEAISFSKNYEYSSFKDYLGMKRGQRAILTVMSDITGPAMSDIAGTPERAAMSDIAGVAEISPGLL